MLQRLFTHFSSSLYVATNQHVYVSDVTILVPSSWDNKPEYEEAGGESFLDANFIVDSPNPAYGDQPYTVEDAPLTECGRGWDRTHLTPDYITGFRQVTDEGKFTLWVNSDCFYYYLFYCSYRLPFL